MRPYRVGGHLFLLTLCVCQASFSQVPTTESVPDRAKLLAEPYVIQRSAEVVDMHMDGTGERVITYSIAVQSEAALRELSVLAILFSRDTQRADFSYVRVVHPDRSVEETPVSSAIEQPAPVTQQAPLYSDLQTKQIPVRSMRVGDTLEWEAKFIQTKAEAPGQFWSQSTFDSSGVRLDDSIELHVPAAVPITTWTNPRAGAQFSEREENGQRIYRWHHSSLKPTVGAEAEAEKKNELKRIRTSDEELDETKGALPSLGWTTFQDWMAVGSWYKGLLENRITPDAAIRGKVAELVAGKSTDMEKAQAIYSFVATHIRYVGVDFGVGHYQPHTAAEVFANQFGDCKDKNVLLASMLSVIGIHADPVLIGANVRFNAALASPGSFNHLITKATIAGNPVWLDATGESGIWGALLSPIRDREALVIPQSGPAVIEKTPADLPFPQTSTFSVASSLTDDLTSESSIVFTVRDDSELILRQVIHSISPANYGEFTQGLMAGLGFGGTTSDPSFDNLDDPSKPLRISFHYHRVKEKDWGENRITATFVMPGLPYFTEEQPATSAIQLGAPRTVTSTVELQLPKGWSTTPPEDTHAHTAFAQCDVIFERKDGKLLEQRSFVVLKPEVPVKDSRQYLSWYDSCGAGSVPYIQLHPPPKASAIAAAAMPAPPSVPSGAAKASDPHAAELVQKALVSLRSADLDSARASLDQAAKINPTQPGLWLMYGYLSGALGAVHQAVEQFQRELQYHPENFAAYSILANTQQYGLHDPAGAVETLKKWVKADPHSAAPVMSLIQVVEQIQGPAEAARLGLLALPSISAEDSRLNDLRVQIATCETAATPSQKVAAEIYQLLPSLSSPATINKAVFILAETGVHMDEAAQVESRILIEAEASTSNWTSSQGTSALDTQNSIAAMWDTTGWMLYRQNKPKEALAYLDAARRLRDDPGARKHYAAVAAQLHDTAAIASSRATDQALRTIRLKPPTGGQNGVVSYRVALADGKLLDYKKESASGPHPPADAESEGLLRSIDWRPYLPPLSKAHLVREVMINCLPGLCEAILTPAAAVRPVS